MTILFVEKRSQLNDSVKNLGTYGEKFEDDAIVFCREAYSRASEKDRANYYYDVRKQSDSDTVSRRTKYLGEIIFRANDVAGDLIKKNTDSSLSAEIKSDKKKGKNLSDYRKNLSMTVEQLSNKLDVSVQTVLGYENGTLKVFNMPLYLVFRYMDCLNISLEQLKEIAEQKNNPL